MSAEPGALKAKDKRKSFRKFSKKRLVEFNGCLQ